MVSSPFEQIGNLPESLDFANLYSQLRAGALNMPPTSIQAQLIYRSYNERILCSLGESVGLDISGPVELSGENNGNQWWLNTSETDENGLYSTKIGYKAPSTGWITATFTNEVTAEHNIIKMVQVKIEGDEDIAVAELEANPSGEVFEGVAALPISGNDSDGVTKLIKFIALNIGNDCQLDRSIIPLQEAYSPMTLGGRLEEDQATIMTDLIEACGSPTQALEIMTFLFFKGATNEQWVNAMHTLIGSGHIIDPRSEARVAMSNNLIGRFFIGGARMGISLTERLGEALGCSFTLLHMDKPGDRYMYQIKYEDGGSETVDEETLVARAKSVVMRWAIDNARFQKNMPRIEG